VEALVDADLFCLPSYQENFGVVVVEALAAGTAALISDQVNIHAEVSGAGAGVAVACDRVALGEAMASMLADRSGLARQGEAGRAMVAERFTWDRIADRVGEMYAAAAGGRAAAGPGSSGGDR
jgi:glycosyltransferase involved in cell wall biosynthesis